MTAIVSPNNLKLEPVRRGAKSAQDGDKAAVLNNLGRAGSLWQRVAEGKRARA